MEQILDSRSADIVWTWAAPMWWVCAIHAGVAALWIAGRRRRFTPMLAAAAVFAAGWYLTVFGGAITLALCGIRGSRARFRPTRIRRGVGVALCATALCAALPAHLQDQRDLVIVALVIAAVCAVTAAAPARRPAIDPRRAFSPSQRQQIAERDGLRCAYCGADGRSPGVQLAVDHVLAHSRGGPTDISNGRLACTPCNTLKSDLEWNEFVRRFVRRHHFAPGEYATGASPWRRFFGARNARTLA